MKKSLLAFAILFLTHSLWADSVTTATTAAPSPDAAPLYTHASQLIQHLNRLKICCPSSSNDVYPSYPPFGAQWLTSEKTDYARNATIRDLAHQAAAMDHADWPSLLGFLPDTLHHDSSYLSSSRAVANEITDAALYQSLYLDDQAAGLTTLSDCMHLTDLLQDPADTSIIRELVADAIASLVTHASNVIVSGITITNDPANHHDLPIATAKQWIARLQHHPTPEAAYDLMTDGEFRIVHAQYPQITSKEQMLKSPDSGSRPMQMLILRRSAMERDLAAMSLAAHVYQFDHHRWPANLKELATELPRVPVDPFGDGTQTLGYALIAHGLPDGGERPMVYSRYFCEVGIFYRTDSPQYAFYRDARLKISAFIPQPGGQFRDVARWVPPVNPSVVGPATRPLAR